MKLYRIKRLIESTIKKLNEQAMPSTCQATPAQYTTLTGLSAWGPCCEEAVTGQGGSSTWLRPECKAVLQVAAGMGLTMSQVEDCCPQTINPINTCPTCNTSHWSNYTSWANYWTNLTNQNPFFLPGANQPCDFICQRIDLWETKCPTVGPNWQNMLACKIDVGYNQANIHGCNC